MERIIKRHKIAFSCTAALAAFLAVFAIGPGASAQPAPAPPPAVGVVAVTRQPVAQSSEYTGKIQSTDRVNLVARVTAFLDRRLFTEGTEVKKGDLLYRLEQAPFQADVQAKEAAVAQFKAQLQNAEISLSRAQTLLKTQAGPQSTVDETLANQQALQAQVLAAEAQLQQSQINLGYTEIRAPIDGKIGRTAVTAGNYVGPNTGVLASIVTQDPMYVAFPVSTRSVLALSQRMASEAHAVVIRVRLPDGRLYDQTGTLDFIDNTVAPNTDTMILRGVIPNPSLPNKSNGKTRELVDGELVTVVLEDAQPVEALTIPRAAVLTDQAGDYVFAVGADHKVEQRRIKLGQSLAAAVVVTDGLSEGESIITEGIQRARSGLIVAPGPAANIQTGAANSAGRVENERSNSRGSSAAHG
jgi:membrane fusion protein (multidrug efflux system)